MVDEPEVVVGIRTELAQQVGRRRSQRFRIGLQLGMPAAGRDQREPCRSEQGEPRKITDSPCGFMRYDLSELIDVSRPQSW